MMLLSKSFLLSLFVIIESASADLLKPVNASSTEWQNMTILQRVFDYDWTKEGIILLTILGYAALYYFGVKTNNSKVNNWIEGHKEILASQFYQVGTHHPKGDLAVSDTPSTHTTYASGRENIRSLTANISLKSRQNLPTLIVETIMGMFWKIFEVKDVIEITIKPSIELDPFIFAVVNKDIMQASRENNYYLSLTRTTDSEKLLPPYFTFMTESAEIFETLFTGDLADAIKNGTDSQNVLDLLAVTDQASDRPNTLEEAAPRPEIKLSLKFPSNSEELETSKKVLNAAINLVDICASKKKWRPEVAKKIKTTREAEIKKVQKQLDEVKAEELAQKKAEKKREQQQNLSKLSPAEQRKQEQKEREKEQKRQTKRQSKKQQVRS